MPGVAVVIPTLGAEDGPPDVPPRDLPVDPPRTPEMPAADPSAGAAPVAPGTTLELDVNDFRFHRSEGILFSPASTYTPAPLVEGTVLDISSPPPLPERAPHLPPRRHVTFPSEMEPITRALVGEAMAQTEWAHGEFERCGLATTAAVADPDLADAEHAAAKFDYKAVEKHLLYRVLAKTKKVDASVLEMVDGAAYMERVELLVQSLAPLLAATALPKSPDLLSKFHSDLARVYAILSTTCVGETAPNAVVATLLLFTGDVLVTLVVGLLVHHFVLNQAHNEQFRFCLLRAVEGVKSDVLLNMLATSKVGGEALEELTMPEFWLDRVLEWNANDTLPTVFNNLIVYGTLSLVGDVVGFYTSGSSEEASSSAQGSTHPVDPVDPKGTEGTAAPTGSTGSTGFTGSTDPTSPTGTTGTAPAPASGAGHPHIPRFDVFLQEYNALHEGNSVSSPPTGALEAQRETNTNLQQHLQALRTRYTDLLTNFQQLNGEAMRVRALEKMKSDANRALREESANLQKDIEAALAHFEVLRVRLEKNRDIERLNEGMRAEIARRSGKAAQR